MNDNREQERLRRLRDQQLAARDPLVKQREFQRTSAQRERNAQSPYSLGRMWKDIPHAWKGFFFGLLLGCLALLVIPNFWISPWAVPCSASLIVVFGLIGMVFGRAFDTRDDIKDLMR